MAESGKSVWLRWYLVLPAAVFLTAVAVQGLDLFRETPKFHSRNLAAAVPASLEGWSVRDMPLGANEFTSKEAEKILNCDEFVNREYRRGEVMFGVYIAYWGPGKMPVRMVACHTPDRCWTENGWHCLEMKFRHVIPVAGAKLQPGEWRKFEPPAGGAPTYVVFWHLVDGKLYDYGERFNSIPDPYRWSVDALRQAFVGCSEQYFIRIASTVPVENISGDSGFAEVMAHLAAIGLAEGSSRSGT